MKPWLNCLHLDPAAEPGYRHQELIPLLAFAQRALQPGQALVLGGDLNTDAWRRCGDGGAGHTFPVHAPDRRIDYLLLRGLTCTRAEVVTTDASDHRPLLVTIQF